MQVWALVRAIVAVLVVASVAATWAAVAPVNPFNLLGYFTIQANLIGAAVLAVGGVRLLRGARPSARWSFARWAAASYLVVVGVVYWALLAPLGAAGGVPVVWANLVLHGATPLLAVLDLLVARDGARPAARTTPSVLVYPLVWTGVVLIRGATDCWVPYPFLDPRHGYGAVAGWVAVVAAAFTGAALLLRPLLPRRPGAGDVPRSPGDVLGTARGG